MELFESIYVFIKLLLRDLFAKNKSKFDRNQCNAHFNLGKKYLSSKQLDRAKEELKKALTFYPYHADAMVYLGIISYHKNDKTASEDYFKKALNNDPRSAKAMYWVGRTHYENERLNKAEKLLKKAIKYNNTFLEAYHYLGLVYLDKGLYDFAIEYLRKTLEIDREWADAFLFLGKAHHKKGETDIAIEMLENAITVMPFCQEAYIYLGECYLSSGNPDRALEMASQAKDIGTQNVELNYLLWRIYKVKGLEDMATLEKKKILQLDPSYSLTLSLSDSNQDISPEESAALSSMVDKFKKM